jgi:ABC-type glycerol-3-phosphate transport system substrate-binding protein
MKAIVIFLVILAVTLTASCVSPTSLTSAPSLVQTDPTSSILEATSTNEPVTIKFWEWFGGAWGDFFEEEANLFHEQYPWITIEVSHYPDQNAYREILALAFESEASPDVFLRRHTFSQVFNNGWAQPLDQWITPEWLSQFPEGSFVETKNMWNGYIYTFPHTTNKFDRVLYINEDIFREAGLVNQFDEITVPQTWNELRTMAKQITAAGNGKYYGVGIGIKDPRHFSWWLDLANLAGAPGTFEIDYRTAKYAFGSDPAFGEIIELLLGMKNDGSIYPNEGSLDDSNLYTFFGQGKFAIFLSGSWSANNLNRDFPDFESYRIISLPVPDSGRQGGLPYTPGNGQFYMSSQTKFPYESWLWLDWIASYGFHSRMVAKGLDFSIYSDLNTPENIIDPKKWQAYKAVTENLALLPFPPARNPHTSLVSIKAVVPDLGDVLIGIYTGQIKDWPQALQDLDKRKQSAFEDAIQQAQADGVDVSINDFIFPDFNPMQDYVVKPNQ